MSPTHSLPLLKRLLGHLPALPELYESLRAGNGAPAGGYRLPELEQHLAHWRAAAQSHAKEAGAGRRVLILGCLYWWIENTAALSLLLAAQGHDATLVYLPYRHWWEPAAEFDIRRQRAYLRSVLAELRPLVEPVDLLGLAPADLPPALERQMAEQSRLDVQYTLQREDVDEQAGGEQGQLFPLRQQRNMAAASRLLALMRGRNFDVAIIPNGTILEFGAAKRVADSLAVPVTTYDFGEQRDRLWLAQGKEVMRLPTEDLWLARGSRPLTPNEEAALDRMQEARRGARQWGTFARQWQAQHSLGPDEARRRLDLDPNKPVALLCTNVVGDSLALDRQLFTQGMADWLEHTVRFFAERSEYQLIVRVHPGELLGAGHPSVDIVHDAVPALPGHVALIPPDETVNTYDLIALAHLGLVYTTTVGIEMAMAGVPVIVAGAAHYRGKGFTNDPGSLEVYLSQLADRMAEPTGRRLPADQVSMARRYAYRFFFEYPFPFPWHVIRFWEDVGERPFEHVVAPPGRHRYASTLAAMTGHQVDWEQAAGHAPVMEAEGG
jgi:hypothetical protein